MEKRTDIKKILKKKKTTIIFIIFSFLIFMEMILMVTIYFQQASQCTANPFSYGIKSSIPDNSNLNIICSCSSTQSQYKNFWFDKNGIHSGNLISPFTYNANLKGGIKVNGK